MTLGTPAPNWSIYADGSSNGRTGAPGGWAYVILRNGEPVKCGYGGWPATTNNQMELQAAIEGLRFFAACQPPRGSLELVCDSKYVLGMASGEYHPSPGKNEEQCRELRGLAMSLGCRTRWVRGHAGDEWNERCDALAKMGKDEQNAGRNHG